MLDFAVFAAVPEELQRARFAAFYRWKGLDENAIDALWQERAADEWPAVDAQREQRRLCSDAGSKPIMIVSCAPFRVSFAGGGSDIASFYRKRRGAVLSCAIAKYSFIVVHPFFNASKYHLKYTRTELVDRVEEIQHPILREALRMQAIESRHRDRVGRRYSGRHRAWLIKLVLGRAYQRALRASPHLCSQGDAGERGLHT